MNTSRLPNAVRGFALVILIPFSGCGGAEKPLPEPVVAEEPPPVEEPAPPELLISHGLAWTAGDPPQLTWADATAWCTDQGMALQEQNLMLLALLRSPALADPPGPYWTSGASPFDETAFVATLSEEGMRADTVPRSELHSVRCFRSATPEEVSAQEAIEAQSSE